MLKQRNKESINLSVSLFKMKFFIALSFTTYQLHTMQKITKNHIHEIRAFSGEHVRT